MRRVVVTGMGAVTPIGIGVDTFWENVKKKTLGSVSYTHLDVYKRQASALQAEGHRFEPCRSHFFKPMWLNWQSS